MPPSVPPLGFTDEERVFELIEKDALRLGGLTALLEPAASDSAFESIDEMPRGMRFILNPGSVGQPRDRDSRASYAILETGAGNGAGADASHDRFTFHRVEYDIARTQKKLHDLRAAGADLDPWLAERLELGQ